MSNPEYIAVFPRLTSLPRRSVAGGDHDQTLQVSRQVFDNIINEELKCPICLGTIEKTFTVSACLHRFCSDCLQRSLRVDLGQKSHHECPACRAKMASRRDARPNPKFDEIIESFMNSYEKKPFAPLKCLEEAVISPKDSKKRKADQQSSKDQPQDAGLIDINYYRKLHKAKIAQFQERQRQVVKDPSYQTKYLVHAVKASASSKQYRDSVGPRICVALFPYPKWEPKDNVRAACRESDSVAPQDLSLVLPFLKLPSLMQIGDLKQYLSNKFKFEEQFFNLLEVLVRFEGKDIVLDEVLTMTDVLMSYWDTKSELALFYRLADA